MQLTFMNLKSKNWEKDLGKKFKKESSELPKNPTAWSKEIGEVRRYILHKFPYKILYSIESKHIFILAIAHQHRQPNYWIDRITIEI